MKPILISFKALLILTLACHACKGISHDKNVKGTKQTENTTSYNNEIQCTATPSSLDAVMDFVLYLDNKIYLNPKYSELITNECSNGYCNTKNIYHPMIKNVAYSTEGNYFIIVISKEYHEALLCYYADWVKKGFTGILTGDKSKATMLQNDDINFSFELYEDEIIISFYPHNEHK